jgi:hypothetical protein
VHIALRIELIFHDLSAPVESFIVAGEFRKSDTAQSARARYLPVQYP